MPRTRKTPKSSISSQQVLDLIAILLGEGSQNRSKCPLLAKSAEKQLAKVLEGEGLKTLRLGAYDLYLLPDKTLKVIVLR